MLKQPLARYVTAVVAGGIVCLIVLIASGGLNLLEAERPELLLLLMACVVVAELTPLKVVLRAAEGEITASNTFAFALLICYGAAPAAVAFALGTILADGIRRKPPERIAFNASQYVITVAAAGVVLSALSGLPHLHDPTGLVPSDLLGIVAAALVFHALNSSFVAGAIALAERIGFWRYLASDLFLQASTAGLLLGLSPVLVIAADFSLAVLPLLFLPLLAVHRGGRQAIAKEHQSLHDALTGLPNRVLFRDRVQQAVRAAERRHGGAAVMIMDLDHFKEVNDTLGHHHGDVLLQEVAERLKTTLRTADTVARLGGDEFGVLLPDVLGAEDAQAVAEILQTALREPFVVDGLTLEMGGSIGIACHPDHGDHVEVLIQRADIAMYSAKEAGRGFALYEPKQDHYSPRRLSLAGELRSALENEELELHYQPKADVVTGRIVGVEALVRWNHPRHGLLGPEEFVPIAEQTGLIVPLTRWVLAASMRQVQSWQSQGYELSVAVNLSARSFLDTAARGRHPDAAQAAPDRAEAARAGGHREHDHARPRSRHGHARAAVRDRPAALDRRLRHRLLVAGQPQAAARRHDQDRQVLRARDGDRALRRRDRALDHRARPQPRPAGHRRGRRGPPDLGGARAPRLRLRPGLLPLAAAAGRQARPEAGHGAGPRGPRRAPAAAPRRQRLEAVGGDQPGA